MQTIPGVSGTRARAPDALPRTFSRGLFLTERQADFVIAGRSEGYNVLPERYL